MSGMGRKVAQVSIGAFVLVAMLLAAIAAGPALAARAAAKHQHWLIAYDAAWTYGPDGDQSSLGYSLDLFEQQGWDVRFVSSHRNDDGYLVYDVITVPSSGGSGGSSGGSGPTYGTGCPGYPTPPFPGAHCYADNGWRP